MTLHSSDETSRAWWLHLKTISALFGWSILNGNQPGRIGSIFFSKRKRLPPNLQVNAEALRGRHRSSTYGWDLIEGCLGASKSKTFALKQAVRTFNWNRSSKSTDSGHPQLELCVPLHSNESKKSLYVLSKVRSQLLVSEKHENFKGTHHYPYNVEDRLQTGVQPPIHSGYALQPIYLFTGKVPSKARRSSPMSMSFLEIEVTNTLRLFSS